MVTASCKKNLHFVNLVNTCFEGDKHKGVSVGGDNTLLGMMMRQGSVPFVRSQRAFFSQNS